jgi:uncharacterized protein YndB with AHSA1/START domain
MVESTDQIQRMKLLRAPIERVWHAISDSKQFGSWFGVELEGPFVAGARITGRIVPTKVDAGVAKAQASVTGLAVEWTIERIEPMRLLSFRWHPFAIDPRIDYSSEPMTLVVFQLEEVAGDTQLTITESGFDRIPLSRRAKAFASNEQGWMVQTKLIEKYLAGLATG